MWSEGADINLWVEEWGAAGWVQVLALEPECLVVQSAAALPAPAASRAPAAVQPGDKQGGGASLVGKREQNKEQHSLTYFSNISESTKLKTVYLSTVILVFMLCLRLWSLLLSSAAREAPAPLAAPPSLWNPPETEPRH